MSDFVPPEIPVHFVYLDEEPEHDREFNALCHVVPRVGETVHAERGRNAFTVVDGVTYRFMRDPTTPDLFLQVTTVLLRDAKPGERIRGNHVPSHEPPPL